MTANDEHECAGVTRLIGEALSTGIHGHVLDSF
jgi:hypothetical protein